MLSIHMPYITTNYVLAALFSLYITVSAVPSFGMTCYLSAAMAMLQCYSFYPDIEMASCEVDSALYYLQQFMLAIERKRDLVGNP